MTVINARDVAYMVPVLRRKAEMTQSELAQKAGVSVRWLSALESGKTTVELSHVLNVYKALGYGFEIVEKTE